MKKLTNSVILKAAICKDWTNTKLFAFPTSWMLYSEPHTLMKNKLNISKNIIKNVSVMSNNINYVKNANLERERTFL